MKDTQVKDSSLPVGELIRYGVAGGIVTLVNIGSYYLLLWFGIAYAAANAVALVFGKAIGYILNKKWVYQSKTEGFAETGKEMLRYALARGFTGLLDFFGLILLVDGLGCDKRLSKWVIMGIVIIMNYILGKIIVFKKKDVDQYRSGNWDKYHSKNPLKRAMINHFNRRLMDMIRACIEVDEGASATTILDAGCGEGFMARMIYDTFPSVKITGLEYSAFVLSKAKEDTTRDISYIQGDVCALPFMDASFDIVLCTEVLEHLEAPERALKEMQRVASKKVVVTVPDEPWFCIGNLLSLKNVGRWGNPPDHVNHWTFWQFKRFTECAFCTKTQATRSFPWSIICFTISGLKD